jgi:hypothetical protein
VQKGEEEQNVTRAYGCVLCAHARACLGSEGSRAGGGRGCEEEERRGVEDGAGEVAGAPGTCPRAQLC